MCATNRADARRASGDSSATQMITRPEQYSVSFHSEARRRVRRRSRNQPMMYAAPSTRTAAVPSGRHPQARSIRFLFLQREDGDPDKEQDRAREEEPEREFLDAAHAPAPPGRRRRSKLRARRDPREEATGAYVVVREDRRRSRTTYGEVNWNGTSGGPAAAPRRRCK